MPTRRRFRAGLVVEPDHSAALPADPALPAELEARIAALEATAAHSDFDAASWFWMIVFGVAVPLVLVVVGWWA
jgi:hypothetical protein